MYWSWSFLVHFLVNSWSFWGPLGYQLDPHLEYIFDRTDREREREMRISVEVSRPAHVLEWTSPEILEA